MIEGDWTLKCHFLDGSLPEEILRERGRETKRGKIHQPAVALMQASRNSRDVLAQAWNVEASLEASSRKVFVRCVKCCEGDHL